MARVKGIKQQRVQFFYDTLFRCYGVSAGVDILLASRTLFAAATPGQKDRTNLQTPGQLAAAQTFLIYAVRHELYMRDGDETDQIYRHLARSLIFELQIDSKIEFEGPVTLTCEGGGVWGFTADTMNPILNLGDPSNKSIYVMPLPIAVTKSQPIAMTERVFDLVTTLVDVNAYAGFKQCRAYIDGFHTRDVQ